MQIFVNSCGKYEYTKSEQDFITIINFLLEIFPVSENLV